MLGVSAVFKAAWVPKAHVDKSGAAEKAISMSLIGNVLVLMYTAGYFIGEKKERDGANKVPTHVL